ncbi:uncharacterized protein LOC133292422 [Gastrolobium bilobum]|uniref:uncharacterized protein LOC133292422 n=1 Tax=Gastrolobium bilobum TaxID=150636 RepID=UPI002AB2AAAD|nr:uncharacterized protein LOC133292422 [Gastrolobium bilobum]
MNCLVWNCRGAAMKQFKITLCNFIRKYKVGLVAILEPRISGVLAQKKKKQIGFKNVVIEEAVGFFGGIWLLWKKELCSISLVEKTNQFIHVNCYLSTGPSFLLNVVYACLKEEGREALWLDLIRIGGSVMGPWMMMGDFNEIASLKEKKGGAPFNLARTLKFYAVLNESKVLDICCRGSRFTWRGPKWLHLNRVFKRLDRVCANADWRTSFADAFVRTLPRLNSDHNPFLLSLFPSVVNWKSRPFRFLAAWQDHSSFLHFLQDVWCSDLTIVHSLANLVDQLKSWNIRVFGCIQIRKDFLLKKLHETQLESLLNLDDANVVLEVAIQKELNEVDALASGSSVVAMEMRSAVHTVDISTSKPWIQAQFG